MGEVGYKAGSYWVRRLPLKGTEVPHHLPNTLPEAQSPVVDCQSSRIKVTFSTHGMQEFEVVHSHLQNLCFLQLG